MNSETTTNIAGSAWREDAALDELRRRVAGRVHVPGDPAWDEVRTPWALAVEQTPLAVVEVVDAIDVRRAVGWAAEHGRQVMAQPVGHGASGPIDQVVLLRTRALRSIEINTVTRTATVGAGVKAGELLTALRGSGLTFLAGSNPDPTVVGMAITGGMSWFGRAHGLTANSIVSAELVDASGRIRRVSAQDDVELFWAIRGGGGDFGIITKLEIGLFPSNELYGGKLLWPIEQMPAVLRAFREVTDTAPEKLTVWFYAYQFPPDPLLPEPLRGKAFAAVAVTYLGSGTAAEPLLRPLRAVPGPVMGELEHVPMDELGRIANEPTDPMPTREHSMLLDDLSDEVIDRLVAAAGAGSGSPYTILKILHLGGQFRTIAATSGACGHVDEPFLLFALGVLAAPGAREVLSTAFDGLDQAMTGHTSGRTVANFLGTSGDLHRIWSPQTRRRLAEIKRAVDPASTIRSNRPVLDAAA
jgi:hypothetical protein